MAKKAKGSHSASSASASAASGKLVLRIKSNEGIKRSVRRTNKPKAKQKKNKIQKFDAMKPKKPPTAFFYFLEDFRKEFQEQNPDVKSMRDIGKACGGKWKTMKFEEKVQYYDIATKKREDFDRAIAEFNKKMQNGEFNENETDEESV